MNARTAATSFAICLLLHAAPAFPTETPQDTSPGRDDAPEASSAPSAASSIVLAPELDGRIGVYDEQGGLVSEVVKRGGRTVELTLEAGTYDIVYQHERALLEATIELAGQEQRVLGRDAFQPVANAPANELDRRSARRPASQGLSMQGRTRIELFGGLAGGHVAVEGPGYHTEVGGGHGGVAITHWLTEAVALDVEMIGTDAEVATFDDAPWDWTNTRGSFGLLCGARYYFPQATFGRTFRPFAALAVGPFSEYRVSTGLHHAEVRHDGARIGGLVAGGVDFQFSRRFSLGVKMGVIVRDGVEASFGSSLGLGFAWGRSQTRD